MTTCSWPENIRELLKEGEQRPMGVTGFVTFEHTSLYLRIARRFVEGEFTRCLQIANISTPEEHQNNGSFKRFLLAAREYTALPFFVEIVQTSRFEAGLQKLGFRVLYRDDGGQANMWRDE